MSPKRSTPNIATRVALSYALVASLWIVGSGLVIFGLPEPMSGFIELGKGLMFVLVTAVMLYVFLARWTGSLIERLSRADEALREQQRISQRLPTGVVVLDSDTRIVSLNPAAEALLQTSAASIRGMPFAEACERAGVAGCADMMPELIGNGSLPDGLHLGTGETERTIGVRAATSDPGGLNEGWVLALTDDSDVAASRRKANRLLAGYRFVSLVSSEIGRARDARQLVGRLCDLAVESGGFVGAWGVVRDGLTDRFVDAGMSGLGAGARRAAGDMRIKADADVEVSRMLARLSGGELIYHNDPRQDVRSGFGPAALEDGIGSYAVFGVIESGRLVAAVGLFAREEGFFGVEERALVETLREDVAFALDRLTLDRKRLDAEEALSQSENAYRRLFEDNPLPMWIYEADTLEFLAVNDAAVAKYGFSRDEFLRMTIKDVRPESDVAPLVDHVARKGHGFQDSGYWTHRDASGREFPVHILTHTTEWAGHPAQLVLVQEVAQVR